MLLDFNIDKSICATGYLIERAGGCEDMFMLLKKVYFADRSALIGWGQSITGDRLASLEKGPVVSGIYNLLKGAGTQERLIKWNEFIERRQPCKVLLRKTPNYGLLSEREKNALENSQKVISAIRGSVPNWLHKHCPEWRDPGKSSIPIDPSTILRLAKKSEDEIRQIEEANEEVRVLRYLLGAQ